MAVGQAKIRASVDRRVKKEARDHRHHDDPLPSRAAGKAASPLWHGEDAQDDNLTLANWTHTPPCMSPSTTVSLFSI